MESLQIRFEQLFQRLGEGVIMTGEVARQWQKLREAYTSKGRYYHNLNHLENMFDQLEMYPGRIADIDAMELSIFYHDAVYRPLRKDNEAKSAELARAVLMKFDFATPAKRGTHASLAQKVERQILATKDHLLPAESDPDLPLLLDIDLAILGSSPERYQTYQNQVRKEYRIFPDLLYRPARRKAMQRFVNRDYIFYTPYFRGRYERQARQNINQFELE